MIQVVLETLCGCRQTISVEKEYRAIRMPMKFSHPISHFDVVRQILDFTKSRMFVLQYPRDSTTNLPLYREEVDQWSK